MNHPRELAVSMIRDDDEDSNHSPNPTFDAIVQARLSRRSMLRGGVGSLATALLGGVGLSACGGSDGNGPVAPAPAPTETLLGFAAVAKSIADEVAVPAGYTAAVLFAVGDPLATGVAAATNNGTDSGYDRRSGDNHDGMRVASRRNVTHQLIVVSAPFFRLQWSKAVGMWAKGGGGGQRPSAQRCVVHGRRPVRRRRIVHMSIARRARSARPPCSAAARSGFGRHFVRLIDGFAQPPHDQLPRALSTPSLDPAL